MEREERSRCGKGNERRTSFGCSLVLQPLLRSGEKAGDEARRGRGVRQLPFFSTTNPIPPRRGARLLRANCRGFRFVSGLIRGHRKVSCTRWCGNLLGGFSHSFQTSRQSSHSVPVSIRFRPILLCLKACRCYGWWTLVFPRRWRNTPCTPCCAFSDAWANSKPCSGKPDGTSSIHSSLATFRLA